MAPGIAAQVKVVKGVDEAVDGVEGANVTHTEEEEVFKIGNAPCSWGTLEFFKQRRPVPYATMLDELVAAGYSGTELGDWGYMPTDHKALVQELSARSLNMLGAFVPMCLRDATTHDAAVERAVRAALLIAECKGLGRFPKDAPMIVLSDDNGTHDVRVREAGRVLVEHTMTDDEWQVAAEGALRVARSVRDATGLRTVFHAHCGGFVETPDELEKLMQLTEHEADLLGVVMDTGHYAFASGASTLEEGSRATRDALKRFGHRIWYIHLKDCQQDIASKSRQQGWDYFTSVERGVFCELGKGCVDFLHVLEWAQREKYKGWMLVEQDVLPGMGTPYHCAVGNYAYMAAMHARVLSESPSAAAVRTTRSSSTVREGTA